MVAVDESKVFTLRFHLLVLDIHDNLLKREGVVIELISPACQRHAFKVTSFLQLFVFLNYLFQEVRVDFVGCGELLP